jgi:hypothetical protein
MVVKTAGTGKKRKCPLCEKYKVKMKSELKKSEKPPAATPPTDPPAGDKDENGGDQRRREVEHESSSRTISAKCRKAPG